ncbi:MAG: hypothetical protein ACYCUT_10410, partial [bacterium]
MNYINMKIFISIFLIIPLFASLSSFIVKNKRYDEYAGFFSSFLSLTGAFFILYYVLNFKTIFLFNNFIAIDKFSAYLILLVSIVYFLSSMYGISYMRLAIKNEKMTDKEFFRYYLF